MNARLTRIAAATLAAMVCFAHGLAVQAIRAKARRGTKVGPAEIIAAGVPVIESPDHIAAAERYTREANAAYLDELRKLTARVEALSIIPPVALSICWDQQSAA